MNKDEAVRIIRDVLAEIQSISGRPPARIYESTCPIGDLLDFDSLNGVEATVELSSRLSIDIPGVNVFLHKNGTKALSVSEVADDICVLTADKESLE